MANVMLTTTRSDNVALSFSNCMDSARINDSYK